MSVQAGGRTIRCDSLVIATHNPLMGTTGAVSAALFQSKLALYTSYVLGARVPKGTVPDGLWWDTSDPYDYLRVDHGIVHGLLQRLDDLIELARTLDDYVRRAAGDA
jgi:hypothetical protein